MACSTISPDGLNLFLKELSLEPIPTSAAAEAIVKPVEIWRQCFASLLSGSGLLQCEAEAILEAISTTSEVSLGDLVLILPRLKLKDVDKKQVKEFAFTLGSKVSDFILSIIEAVRCPS
jgi:arginyl-tRNA synthetase